MAAYRRGPIEARAGFVTLIEQWQAAVHLQVTRLFESHRAFAQVDIGDGLELQRLDRRRAADSHFLVISLRQLEGAIRFAADRDPESGISGLLAEHEDRFPSWRALRNAFEHMTDYIENRGRLQRQGRMAQHPFEGLVDALRSGADSATVSWIGGFGTVRSARRDTGDIPELYVNVLGVEIEVVSTVRIADGLADGAVTGLMHTVLPRLSWEDAVVAMLSAE